ncbi:MAG TPA: nucleoside transporter C-terminal domain-containing protein [Bacteroidales bacterium]|nr:nucleoside transporter C-terminal domain-containing protein [Bacteroidales bacterium]HOX78142.1 nucleoside transporter C-terminal domain-containing protein [Bacteroidales bacterium]HPM93042.1 nucleoside transporter C-terminal domain-containing protein [Bacteroidales bacterium]
MKLKSLLLIFVMMIISSMPLESTAQTGQDVTQALSEAGAGFSIQSLLRGILGMMVLLGICYLFSTNRKAISWRVVIFGLLLQAVLAITVLKVPAIQHVIEFIARVFIKILDSSNAGSSFLFKSLVTNKVETGLITFAFQILPTIIFFSALTSVLFYYGIIQKVVWAMAWLLTKLLKISGAEGLVASSNVFLGQTEAPFLIKEYLPKMNRSEIMLVMVAGMATMAGGVLAIYIGLLGGDDPVGKMIFAQHLITASVMAAPAAVVTSKMLVPQTEPIESDIKITKERIGSNILDAIANGTTSGLKLAVNVAAMLIAFIALIYFLNFIFGKIGDWTHVNAWVADITGGQYSKISLQFFLGYLLAPLTWLMGVNSHDMTLVGQLLGEKIILNEMIGYASLQNLISSGVFYDQKSVIIAVYVLCGFANFSSVGIQIGGISAIAPNQRKTLSDLGFRALLGGGLSALLSATLVAIILG